jgi:uncharacterized membrane protein YeiH
LTDIVTDSAPFIALEMIGTSAFAVSGVMAAARARMDWLGAIVLALAVAIGGGTIRDLLIGQVPVTWLERPWPVFVAIGTAIIMLAILRVRPFSIPVNSRPLLIADALGLGAFVIVGTQIGLEASLSPFLAVLLGVLTGVGGGVIRDLLTASKPVVLTGQIYAVAGIVGGVWLVVLESLQVPTQVGVWSAVVIILAIRLISINRNWHLPKVIRDNGDSATAD